MAEFEAVIGLETHIQLNTESKIFCSCKADSWLEAPNTNICPVCCGLPGVLPVLNKAAVEKAVLLAQAMHAAIQPRSFFDRKNYFYPDLPKGYQISQFDQPIAIGGYLDVPMPSGYTRRVNIHKLHLEEDAGKTKIEGGRRLIDFNRCGVPLVEMVTEPDLRSAEEAMQYLARLRQLVRWLGVSEGDMEKAHLRCDANVSIRPKGATYLNPKTEIKNVNSLAAVRDAIQMEIERQIRAVQAGRTVEAWTLMWDEDAQVLRKMRSKETEADYRYFKEPDLLPLLIPDEWKEKILANFPELPLERKERFIREYNLPEGEAELLTSERSLSEYYEATVKAYQGEPKRVANWVVNDVLRIINEKPQPFIANQLRLTPEFLAQIIKLVDDKTINTSTGKSLLTKVEESGKSPQELVQQEGLAKLGDSDALEQVCQQVLADNPNEVATYKKGKVTLIGWFVGQVMQRTRGKADPQLTRSILEKLLNN